MFNNNIYDSYDRERRSNYKAYKTIKTLCNYILKLTDDEKAIKRATKELRNAEKKIENIESIELLMNKITDMNCDRISSDETLSDSEKSYNLKQLRKAQKELSIK